MQRFSFALATLMVLTMSACLYEKTDHPASCRTDADCKKSGGGKCVLTSGSSGFCVVEDGGARNVKDTDGGAKVDGGGGQTGEACKDGQAPMDCYDAPGDTEDVGMCRGGQRVCASGKYTQCLGQTLPAEEMCNGKDDDCDGKTDEIQMGDCETQMPGVCNAGALQCLGMYAVCEPVDLPVDEVCNGDDDDCDGKTDEEMSAVDCYPDGAEGCKAGPDGVFVCIGLCKAGGQVCKDGESTCADARVPGPEICTKGNAIAADENCDGKIDEGCPCTTGAERSCYSGPAGTAGKGTCRAGKQTCVNRQWGGQCEGEVVAEAETCDNPDEDNDCNGTIDDIPKLGANCLVEGDMGHGICSPGTRKCVGEAIPQCVSKNKPQPEICDDIDQDCDGDPHNGFDLNTDNANCGKCGERCDTREKSCCEGGCWDLKEFSEDAQNCGSCGNVCKANQFCCQSQCVTVDFNGGHTIPGPIADFCQCDVACRDGESCCGKSCVDLANDPENCGACGHSCKNILGGDGRCCGTDCCGVLEPK